MKTMRGVDRRLTTPVFGPGANGKLMTPGEFDRAEFEEGWRYELIRGVLIVSPSPLEEERDPNEELGRLLRNYQDRRPFGRALDKTLSEQTISTGDNRRRADRVIWAGLGRRPRRGEVPTIVVEFVSAGRESFLRDYETKKDEFRGIGVREYWVIDRFDSTMSVWSAAGQWKRRVYRRSQVFKTTLLPGFQLPLKRLFDLADEWARQPPADGG